MTCSHNDSWARCSLAVPTEETSAKIIQIIFHVENSVFFRLFLGLSKICHINEFVITSEAKTENVHGALTPEQINAFQGEKQDTSTSYQLHFWSPSSGHVVERVRGYTRNGWYLPKARSPLIEEP